MEKLREFLSSVGESGLRKAGVGLYIFTALCGLRFYDRVQDAIFGQCVMMLIGILLPAMAAENFAKPKE